MLTPSGRGFCCSAATGGQRKCLSCAALSVSGGGVKTGTRRHFGKMQLTNQSANLTRGQLSLRSRRGSLQPSDWLKPSLDLLKPVLQGGGGTSVVLQPSTRGRWLFCTRPPLGVLPLALPTDGPLLGFYFEHKTKFSLPFIVVTLQP